MGRVLPHDYITYVQTWQQSLDWLRPMPVVWITVGPPTRTQRNLQHRRSHSRRRCMRCGMRFEHAHTGITTEPRRLTAPQTRPAASATCITAGSPSLRMVTCVDPSTSSTLPASQLHCGSAAPSLSTGSAKTILVRRSFATNIGVAPPLRNHSQYTQVDIDHRALDASDVDIEDACQPHNVCTFP